MVTLLVSAESSIEAKIVPGGERLIARSQELVRCIASVFSIITADHLLFDMTGARRVAIA